MENGISFFNSILFDAVVISYFRWKDLSNNKPSCENAVVRVYGSCMLRLLVPKLIHFSL